MDAPRQKKRVFIADDHALVREGLAALVTRSGLFEVVGQCGDGAKVVEEAVAAAPDIIVLDVRMPGLNGLDICRELRHRRPEVAVLILSMHIAEEFIIRALENGAKGYLLKESAAEELVDALVAVAAGQMYLGRGISGAIVARLQKGLSAEEFIIGALEDGAKGYLLKESAGEELAEALRAVVAGERYVGPSTPLETLLRLHKAHSDPYQTLTARERQVLQLINEGCTNKKIADALGLAVKTVDTHRTRLMRKLNIHDQASLAGAAVPLPGIIGSWRIFEVTGVDADLLDVLGEAFIRFGTDGPGDFRFACLKGALRYRLGEPDSQRAVEWSWQGHEGKETAAGRGWAAFGRGWTLAGQFSFEGGREVTFKAKKTVEAIMGVRAVVDGRDPSMQTQDINRCLRMHKRASGD